jgi:hypothetical protein
MLRTVCSARAGFTRADIQFIESLGEASGWESPSAANGPDWLQEMLDDPLVRRTLLESPVALPVSPSLYFFVLVRHALLESDIDHTGLADHIAGVMVDKLSWSSRGSGGVPHWATHAVDFISLIRNASGLLRVHLEVAAGDQFLILTGLFPEFLHHRCDRYGAPSADFYGAFARHSYHSASGRNCLDRESRELFGLLAEVYPIASQTLHRMRDHCLFLGD